MSRKSKHRMVPVQQAPNPGKLAIQAQYDVARQGRRLVGWNPASSGPNRAAVNLQIIRNRSRDAVRNEWSASSTVRNLVVDIVGTGITARPRTKRATLKNKLSLLWDDFTRECDADGVLDMYGIQELVVRTWKEAGECFVRLRARRLDDGLTVPLQVQLIEPELCPLLDQDLPDGNRIRQGIEIDRIGRRVAYWMYPEHPGDYNTMVRFNELVRVPAEQILHIYKVDRAGQMRGVPKMTSTLIKMKTVGDYDDAVVEKAKLQNLYVGVIKKPEPSPGSEGIDPLSGQVISYSDLGQPTISMEPGAMLELAPGEDIEFSNPPATGVGYNDFMRQQGLSISGGNGVPYEILTGDIINISDRTLRVIIQQYRRCMEQEQWIVVIPMFCQKVRAAWVDAAILAGKLSVREAVEAKDVDWSPQAWAYIHPVQDAQGKIAEIDAGITSRSAVIAARGYDPELIDAERAADADREKKLGLTPPPVPVGDPAKQKADTAKAVAEAALIHAQAAEVARLTDAEIDRSANLAQAQSEALFAEAACAKANLSRIEADIAAAAATVAHNQAIADQESTVRIAACEAAAADAQREAKLRAEALRVANAFAAKQQTVALAAEKDRADTLRMEAEAARICLAELKE